MNKRHGFTLIELLVVIAIIAILAAILFPVMTQAKYSAKVSMDLEHQRQIGQALMLYADNNSGYLPYLSLAESKALFPKYAVNSTISGQLIIKLKPYIKSVAIFYCPVNDAYDPAYKQYSYAYQSKLNPPFMYMGYYYYVGKEWSVFQVLQAGNPNRILLNCIGGGVTTNSARSGHGRNTAIYLFSDGHAQLIRHFEYPYNGTECKDLQWKLLLPRWKY